MSPSVLVQILGRHAIERPIELMPIERLATNLEKPLPKATLHIGEVTRYAISTSRAWQPTPEHMPTHFCAIRFELVPEWKLESNSQTGAATVTFTSTPRLLA